MRVWDSTAILKMVPLGQDSPKYVKEALSAAASELEFVKVPKEHGTDRERLLPGG
jgi:hypothetical protein